MTPWGWTIDPKGLRYVLNQYYERYGLPLFIVENGFGYEDQLENGQIHDTNRINYLRSHIQQMVKAVEEDAGFNEKSVPRQEIFRSAIMFYRFSPLDAITFLYQKKLSLRRRFSVPFPSLSL